MSKYEPLTRFLTARPEREVPMTFRQLEGVLGFPLPASARKHQAWWANTKTHSYAEAWMGVGRRTERLDLAGGRVTFVAVASANATDHRSPGFEESVTIPLSAFSPRAMRLVRDRAGVASVDLRAAVVEILEEAALDRRRRLIDEIAASAPKRIGSSSADLIREDRDAR